jgi:hypothetical protein
LQLEEAKLLRAQSQDGMAISLAKYIIQNYESNEEASDVYRLVGKWLAETRSSKLYTKFICSENLFWVPSMCSKTLITDFLNFSHTMSVLKNAAPELF